MHLAYLKTEMTFNKPQTGLIRQKYVIVSQSKTDNVLYSNEVKYGIPEQRYIA